MQSLDKQLQTVDAKTLTEFVCQALNDRTIVVIEWSYTKINVDGVPATAGVYRFAGTAQSDEQRQRWSLVLKVLRWVNITNDGQDLSNAPTHILYWKREALVFQSGILSSWNGGLVPVKCYGVTEPTADSVWLWLEDIQETTNSQWDMARHILAARHFGEFNGSYAREGALPDLPWLNRNFISQYLSTISGFGAGDCLRDASLWEHPLAREVFPIPIAERIVGLLENSDKVLNRLATHPQTLSHQDTDRRNLFARQSSAGNAETVVIDWGFLGLATVGEDLGNQVLGNLFHLEVDCAAAHHYQEAAFAAYLEGLQKAGWQGSPKHIRLAYAAQAFTYIVWVPLILASFVKESQLPHWANKWAQQRGASAEETMKQWGEAIYFILDIADST